MQRPILFVSVGLATSALLVPSAKGSTMRPEAQTGLGRLLAVDAAASDDVWAVGLSTAHGKSNPLTEHWDGTRWSVVSNPGPAGGSLGAVTIISSNDVWAVGGSKGHTLAMHWDGSSWTVFKSPSPRLSPALLGVAAVAPDDVWAVGNRDTDEEFGTVTLVEHWDGTHWSIVPSPNPDQANESSLSAVTAIGASNVLGVGTSDHSQLAERWDGTQWQLEQTAKAGPESGFEGVHAIAGDDIWAVGAGFRGSYLTAITQHWDGTTWRTIPPHTPSKVNTSLISVDGDATDDVWAVGIDHPISGKNHTLAMHWDGTAWSRAPTPSPVQATGSDLVSVAVVSPVDAWAVGLYAVGGFKFKPLIEHWDGTSWTKVKPG